MGDICEFETEDKQRKTEETSWRSLKTGAEMERRWTGWAIFQASSLRHQIGEMIINDTETREGVCWAAKSRNECTGH